jgi:hypothetical protein
MNKKDSELLLKKYIKEALLTEDDIAGVNFGGFGYMPMGQLSPDAIRGGFKGLAKPFKDVADAAKAVGGKALAAGERVLKTGISGTLEMLTGGLIKADYKKIHDDFENEIKSINSKYADAIKSSWEVLGKEAPLMAVLGLPAALTIKTAVENPKLFGAAAALAGVGGADVVFGKVASILGLPGAAGTAATAVAGAKVGEKVANESRKRNREFRIMLETKQLTDSQKKELEELIPQLQKAAEKVTKEIEADVNAAVVKLTKGVDALTTNVDKSIKQANPDKEQKNAATNVLQDEQEKLSKIKQKIFGDKPSPALDAALTKTSGALSSVSSSESSKPKETGEEKKDQTSKQSTKNTTTTKQAEPSAEKIKKVT